MYLGRHKINNMKESEIKELKSIYSSKIRKADPTAINSDIKSLKSVKSKKTFFNGVIEKLNIIVN